MKITIGQLRQLISEAAKGKKPSATLPEAKDQLKAAIDGLFAATGRKGTAAVGPVVHALTTRGKQIERISWWYVQQYLDLDGEFATDLSPKTLFKAFAGGIEEDITDASLYEAEGPYRIAAYLEVAAWVRDRTALLKAHMASLRRAKGGEDPDAPLGRFAFANNRMASAAVPKEPDELLERGLFAAIAAHFDENQPLGPEIAKQLRAFLADGMYSDVIKEPDAEEVFRGVNSGPNWIRKILRVPPGTPIEAEGEADVSFTYSNPKDRSAVMSWATKEAAAMRFFKSSGSDVEDRDAELYTLLLTARVGDNPATFISGPDGLYKLKGPNDYKNEAEALALGPVKVTHVKWRGNAAAREAADAAKKPPKGKPAKGKGKKK